MRLSLKHFISDLEKMKTKDNSNVKKLDKLIPIRMNNSNVVDLGDDVIITINENFNRDEIKIAFIEEFQDLLEQ